MTSPADSDNKPAPARHCDELLGSTPRAEELAAALSLLGGRLARVLPVSLARVAGGDPAAMRVGTPAGCTIEAVENGHPTLCSHSLMGIGTQRLPMLVSFEAAPVLRLVDRAFGGSGKLPDPLPEAFPLSAELLLARIEQAIATALWAALGDSEEQRAHPMRRDTNVRQLDPFAKGEDLMQLGLEVIEDGLDPWALTLTFPHATLIGALLAPRPVRRARKVVPDPASEPFASVPMPVTAVLVDMTLGFSRLSELQPGDVLPVAVARSVPLQVDGRTIATGTIGEVEDRVAVQIQNAF